MATEKPKTGERERINLVLNQLLRSEEGTELLRWIVLDLSGVNRVGLGEDAYKTAFVLGAASVGQKLLKRVEEIAADPVYVGRIMTKPKEGEKK